MSTKHFGNTQPAIDQEEHTHISGVAGKKVFNIDSGGNIIDFGTSQGSAATYGNATITASATQIAASDTTRRSVIVQNISTATVFVGTDNAVTADNGIKLQTDDTVILDRYDGDVYGIADATGQPIRFLIEKD